MTTEVEAPARSLVTLSEAASRPRGRDAGVRRASRRSTASTLRVAAGRDRRGRRARAAAASRRCSSSSAACRRPTPARVARRPAVLMPQRDGLLPWLSALDNAALALRVAGRVARAGARAARTRSSPRFGLEGFERARPARAVAAACASASRSCARCSPGKPVLCLDEPFGALDALTRARDAGLARARRCAREPRTVLLVTHDVEEAVAARRPRRACSRRGPGAWWPSSRSPAAAARARPTRGRRAARARAGGAAGSA